MAHTGSMQIGEARWKSHLYVLSAVVLNCKFQHWIQNCWNFWLTKSTLLNRLLYSSYKELYADESGFIWGSRAVKYIPLTLGRLNPHLHWIWDEQNPYAALPTDPVLFSHHTFLFAITASSAKKMVLKLISIMATSWFLIADWQETNITVHLHNVTAFKAGCTPSDPKVCGHNQGKLLPSSHPWHFLIPNVMGAVPAPAFTVHFIYVSTQHLWQPVLNLALEMWGIGGMDRFSCMAKMMKISWCSW